jgi:hypothetical protein
MCRYRKAHPVDLVVTTGDNIYADGSAGYFETNFFEPFDCLLDAGVQFRASLGNHDVATHAGQPELDDPRSGSRSATISFVGRESGSSSQLESHSQGLAQAQHQGARRRPLDRGGVSPSRLFTGSARVHPRVIGLDAPAISSPWSGSGSQQPRSHLLGYPSRLDKIKYVVTAGGGASLYDCSDEWFVAKCRERNHFLYVIADESSLLVRAVPPKGKPFARFATQGTETAARPLGPPNLPSGLCLGKTTTGWPKYPKERRDGRRARLVADDGAVIRR